MQYTIYNAIYNSITLNGNTHTHIYIYIYDPGSAVPPPPPPPNGSPLPVVWCGVVRGWVCLGWFDRSPLWHGVGSGFLAVVPPCVFGSALGVWYTHPDDDNDVDDGDDDHHHHH